MTGGGDISIRTDNRYMDKAVVGYETIEKGEYVTLSVSDTGIGISKEDIGRVFEPFYTRKVMGRSGTGLGMAVVWGTIKDHGGFIDVQSTEGEGTTFTLYFPATRRATKTENSHISMDSYKGMGETILIVDDEKEQREIASDILKKLGYNVTTIPSGEGAVDLMRKESVDLIVLDMIMEPGIDGLETFKRILEFRPGQRAIIASGFSETERIKEVQSLGAGPYIKKPYTLEKIGIAVRGELDKKVPKA
jgi:CheY-like chemotaxis protein